MPHSTTISSVLPVCAQLLPLEWGREIHYYLIQSGIDENLFVRNALLDTYAKCQSLQDALYVFQTMSVRDVVSWNAMISGCAHKGYCDEDWKHFSEMQLVGVKPNLTTWNLMIARFSQNGLH